MRFADDLVAYSLPRRRVVYDYGYQVNDSELARVEDAARLMSSQTIEDADRIRDISRRSDQLAIERANRMIDQQSVPTSHLRAHRYPVSSDMMLREQARGLNNRLTRSMSVSDLSDAQYYYIPVPGYVAVSPRGYLVHPTNNHHIPPHRYGAKRHDMMNYRRIYAPPPVPGSSQPVSDYRRRLERRLDTDLLNYELPSADTYHGIRETLRGVNDKLLAHRLLLDRYAGIEMSHPASVEEQVESKYSELMARMPTLNRRSREDSYGGRY